VRQTEKAWEAFKNIAILDCTPCNQVVDMKRAFYAGVATALGSIKLANKDKQVDKIRDIEDDIIAFMASSAMLSDEM